MATRTDMWLKFGMRVQPEIILDRDDIVAEVIRQSGFSRRQVASVFAYLDEWIAEQLMAGHEVVLNGLVYRNPVIDEEGRLTYTIELAEDESFEEIVAAIDEEGDFDILSKSEDELVDLWNRLYPHDPIVD